MAKINVLNSEITVFKTQDEDYISLTDIAKSKNHTDASDIIRNWLRNRNTIEFLGVWEKIHNPNFKVVEFDGFKKDAGLNSFTLSSKKWIKSSNSTVEFLIFTSQGNDKLDKKSVYGFLTHCH
jgi:hypothetical protein